MSDTYNYKTDYLTYLSCKVLSSPWGACLGISSNVTTTQLFDRDVFNVETNIVSRNSFRQSFVMHLDGLYLSGQIDWGKHNNHT